MKEIILKKKNFIYDNGLVNCLLFLNEKNKNNDLGVTNNELDLPNFKFKDKVSLVLYTDKIIISGEKNDLDDFFNFYLEKAIGELVHFTENPKFYWDQNNETIVEGKKVDIKFNNSRNEIKNSYLFENVDDLYYKNKKLTKEAIIKAAKEKNLNEKEIGELFFDKKSKNRVRIYPLMERLKESYANYLVKEMEREHLILDSKIHPFEDGKKNFKDYISARYEQIYKWDALIYWLGSKFNKYYDNNLSLFLHSSSLLDLYEAKNLLNINNVDVEEENKKTGKFEKKRRNIKYDKILDKLDFYSYNEADWELRIVFVIYRQLRKFKNEGNFSQIFENFQSINLISFTEDGDFKSSLNVYTQLYNVIKLLESLENYKIEVGENENSNLLNEFSSIIKTTSKNILYKDDLHFNLKILAKNFLTFNLLTKNYMTTQENALRSEKLSSLPKTLNEFEQVYLKLIGKNNEFLLYHNLSQIVGDGIGKFLGSIDDKALIFNLRSVRNYEQLIKFISQFKFSALKDDEKARFNIEFNEALNSLLPIINSESWEIVRDYMAIYMISAYKRVNYAINNNNNK